MGERKSKIPWPGAEEAGGDLERPLQVKLEQILDEFGIALENEADKAKVSIYSFPIFREFNMVAAITAKYILYFISPSSGGIPKRIWLDFRHGSNQPNPEQLVNFVHQRFGWTSIWQLQFTPDLLTKESNERLEDLYRVAREETQDKIINLEREAKIVRINPLFKGREFIMEDDLCFVLLPFREPFLRLYEEHIRPTLVSIGLHVMKADDIFTSTTIIEDIWEHINKSRLIVADVTGKNPNVFYELGIAHTVGKDFVILTQNSEDVPFDLRHLRYFLYTDNKEGWKNLKQNLENAVRTIIGK